MKIDEIQAKLFEALYECSFYEDIKNKFQIDIDAKTSFFDTIKIESIQLLEFIIHIEKILGQSIDFEKLAIENFDTIEKLSVSLFEIGMCS